MKKRQHFLLMILAIWLVTAVSAQENNGFHVQFSVSDATCYNNGKVMYTLTDSSGTALDSLPQNMSQVRIYYKMNDTDSAHYAGWYYSGGTDTLTINYGTYIIGVEALVEDSVGNFSKVDTQTVITLGTTYHKPTMAIVSKIADSRGIDAGTLFSVPCAAIGRVQLRILSGQYPYIVTITDAVTGDTLRTDIFDERQYDGTNESHYNYKDYYSIDSLPGGNWAFYLEDGCGYGLPQVSTTVTTQTLPDPANLCLYASSGNFADSNVVKVSMSYFSSFEGLHGLMHQYGKYRFNYEGIGAGEWHPMPYDTTVVSRYTLYDTVDNIGKYCDLWNKNITFECKVEGCGWSHDSYTFQYLKPNEIYFVKDTLIVTDSINLVAGNCMRESNSHTQHYGIQYYKGNEPNGPYYPNNISGSQDHVYYRYHYTHPLTWVYSDTRTGNIIKRDTIEIITDKTLLTREEVDLVYGSYLDTLLIIPVERKLLDGKGCELYVTQDTFRFMRHTDQEAVSWSITYNDEGGQCCTYPRWIRIFRASNFGSPTDGTFIRLKRSPLDNQYNFEAVYHAADKTWIILKKGVENTAALLGDYNGLGFTISDYCLPSGPYEFEIITPCGTLLVSDSVLFNDFMEMQVTEDVECYAERDCSNLYVHYPKGEFQWMRTNTDKVTGLPSDTIYQNVDMRVTVVEAPSSSLIGSYITSKSDFTFSFPGRYVLRTCPNVILNECSSDFCRYDTFYLEAATVEFVEALAVLCDSSSTEGDVMIRANNGILPYTFTLYDQPDKLGNILAVNNTGVFPNMPMHSNQTLSCFVQDSCGAYFHVNFMPSTMADLQKLWFDGGLTMTSACEGTTIQVHALAVGNIWQYEWSGPGGFSDTTANPSIFVPSGSSEGWYEVIIRQTGCVGEIRDSIYLIPLPAPTVTHSPDTTICPGGIAEVRFTPHSSTAIGGIDFSIAFATEEKVTVRNYSAADGETVIDTFTTLYPAKIYPITIQDDQCEYLLADPDDTIFIHTRQDIASRCRIITTFDTVCFGSDAHLSAKATDSVPYIIRWYGDYALTQLLKSDTLTDMNSWSIYDTIGIRQRTLLYTSLQKGSECPSVNKLTDSTMNMQNGETTLACGRHLRLYDSGGPNNSGSSGEYFIHRFHTSDGTRASIHFDELALAKSAHLLIFSGDSINTDSLLLDLSYETGTPKTAVSYGNSLTVLYMGQNTLNSDWSAVVETAPGIAVADVLLANTVSYQDEVCQSQINVYDDPYGMVPSVASAEELNSALRKAGNYYFSHTFPAADKNGCDSTVNFRLTVNPPTTVETSATATQQTGFFWHGNLYTESGRYVVSSTDANGCDHLEILYLNILNVDCQDKEICRGDSTTLTISSAISSTYHYDSLITRRIRPGDVLCTDGTILSIDSFLNSGKSPKGVVFHIDETGIHGMAISLTETSRVFLHSTPLFLMIQYYSMIHSAKFDSDGEANTLHLKVTEDAYSQGDFSSDASAVSYCYYYNHNTLSTDGEHHGWYLPSFNEFNILHCHFWEVKRSLNMLKQSNSAYKTFESPFYWSSTIQDDNNAWTYCFSGWNSNPFNKSYGVRPITKF